MPDNRPATGSGAARYYGGSGASGGSGMSGGGRSANLGDILERVLDKGLVIAGDIQVNLLDIELLTIKLRLVIASLETAREVGIDWWENDPWLNADASRRAAARLPADGHRQLREENRRLQDRIRELESGDPEPESLEAGEVEDELPASVRTDDRDRAPGYRKSGYREAERGERSRPARRPRRRPPADPGDADD